MNLFKKKQKPAPAAGPKLIMESTFTRSNHFRGFKRFHVTVHGVPEAEQNNEKLHDADLSGAEISFRVFSDGMLEFANAYINGALVGVIWDENQIAEIKNKRFDSVHALFDEEKIVGKTETITRPRVRFFVRYAE